MTVAGYPLVLLPTLRALPRQACGALIPTTEGLAWIVLVPLRQLTELRLIADAGE